MKKIITFLAILFPWFLGGLLFSRNTSFYQSLQLPFFAPPGFLFPIIWTILYILIAISIYKAYQIYHFGTLKSYNKSLLCNYILNQLFPFFFFTLENIFLGFVDSVATLITSLFVYYETKEIDKKASKFLLPYIYWCLFACILCITIYFMNL